LDKKVAHRLCSRVYRKNRPHWRIAKKSNLSQSPQGNGLKKRIQNK
jgi:hypothetical protein